MGAFWDLIDEHLQRMDFPPAKRRLALHLGVAPQTLSNWQSGLINLPERKNLEAVATFVGKTYGEVLLAALSDTGYARGAGLATSKSSSRPSKSDIRGVPDTEEVPDVFEQLRQLDSSRQLPPELQFAVESARKALEKVMRDLAEREDQLPMAARKDASRGRAQRKSQDEAGEAPDPAGPEEGA